MGAGPPGDRLTIPLDAPAEGEYELIGFFTRAQDYGIIRIHVNGEEVGDLIDLYNPQVRATGPISLGRVRLDVGANELVVEIIGKDVRSAGYSDGYLVGIDGFVLRD